jgi:hypothetical protein
MRSSQLLTLLVISVLLPNLSATQEALPGAITSTVSIASINNIVNTFVPILSYYMLDNKTMNFHIEEKGIGYKVDLEGIHIDTVDGWTVKEVEFLPGKDMVRFLFSGININMQVNGTINALWLINLDAATCNITNLTVQLDLAVVPADEIHWTLVSNPIITIQDVVFKTTSSWFNHCLNMMHSMIVKTINSDLAQFEKNIVAAITVFAQKMNSVNSTSFMANVFNNTDYLLNMSTTATPVLDNNTQLLSLHLEGLFYDMINQTSHVTSNVVYPPRLGQSHSEQFWIHESMINSLFLTYGQSIMPMAINNKNLTDLIKLLFPELKKYYGQDVDLTLSASIDTQDEYFARINASRGMVIGNKNSTVLTVRVYATNETTVKEFANEFQMFLEMDTNITFQNFIFYANIENYILNSINLTVNNCHILPRNYDLLFASLFDTVVGMVYDKFGTGMDLTKISSTVGFVAGMF